jgi:flavin reductase (DIM6/NTAB) family NADH-FMN oxidoreductase RutF
MSLSELSSMREVTRVSSQAFRDALGCFATGIVVITLEQDRQIHGLTVNAFTSISLEPPLVLVCINCKNRTHEHLQSVQRFGFNILSEEQGAISEYFAQPGSTRSLDPKIGARFSRTKHGTPVLEGTLAFLECRLQEIYRAGDHTLFLAEVEEIALGQGGPLLYFRGEYTRMKNSDHQNDENHNDGHHNEKKHEAPTATSGSSRDRNSW